MKIKSFQVLVKWYLFITNPFHLSNYCYLKLFDIGALNWTIIIMFLYWVYYFDYEVYLKLLQYRPFSSITMPCCLVYFLSGWSPEQRLSSCLHRESHREYIHEWTLHQWCLWCGEEMLAKLRRFNGDEERREKTTGGEKKDGIHLLLSR